MRVSILCFVVAAIIFLIFGLDLVKSSSKINWDEIGLFFISAGLAITGWVIPLKLGNP